MIDLSTNLHIFFSIFCQINSKLKKKNLFMKRVSCTFNGDVINSKSGHGYIILQIQSKLHFCVINRIKKLFVCQFSLPLQRNKVFSYKEKETEISSLPFWRRVIKGLVFTGRYLCRCTANLGEFGVGLHLIIL